MSNVNFLQRKEVVVFCLFYLSFSSYIELSHMFVIRFPFGFLKYGPLSAESSKRQIGSEQVGEQSD
jgi:hypothetical protein